MVQNEAFLARLYVFRRAFLSLFRGPIPRDRAHELAFEEERLAIMWDTAESEDEFDERLRILGGEEDGEVCADCGALTGGDRVCRVCAAPTEDPRK